MWRYDISTCEDIDDFTVIKLVSLIALKFVGVSSKHIRVFLESLRQSSEIFGHLRKFSENVLAIGRILENLRKVVGNLRKIVKTRYTLVRRYEFYFPVARTISYEWAQRTSEILFMPLEHKIHIFPPPCHIVYILKLLYALCTRCNTSMRANISAETCLNFPSCHHLFDIKLNS